MYRKIDYRKTNFQKNRVHLQIKFHAYDVVQYHLAAGSSNVETPLRADLICGL